MQVWHTHSFFSVFHPFMQLPSCMYQIETRGWGIEQRQNNRKFQMRLKNLFADISCKYLKQDKEEKNKAYKKTPKNQQIRNQLPKTTLSLHQMAMTCY